jgi:osmotically-inducible protein OsmY
MTPRDPIAQAVLTELDWEPGLDRSQVRVLVSDGIAFLDGRVRSLSEKWAASRAARRAAVLDVYNQIEVVPRLGDRSSDNELQSAVLGALLAEPHAPRGEVAVEVSNGHVTIRGDAEHPLEIDAAAAAVRRLPGVVGLHNRLSLRGRPPGRFTL